MDPALDAVDGESLRRYLGSRDIDDLGDLSKLSEQPSLFHCLPLSVLFENSRVSFLDEGNADAAWLIFAFHVDNFKNFPDAPRQVAGRGNDNKHLPDEAREMFDPETIIEIARVICEMPGRGDTNPFSPLAGWEHARIRRTAYHALRAETAPVDLPDTKPAVGEASPS